MSDYLPIPIVRIPGNGFIHRLHPIPKLIWAVGSVVLAFATRNPLVLGVIFLVGLACFFWSGTWRGYRRFALILFPISLSLMVFQSLAPAFPRPWIPLGSLGPFTIYNEGVYSGLSMLARAWSASNFAILLIMTTHPSDLFAALQAVGVPYEINFMVMSSLQLIPIVQREFTIVLSAQRSRGMKTHGFGAVLPSMVPVFATTIERVQQLSMSLEARAFGSKGKKTSLREVTATPKDWAVGILGVALTAAGVLLVIRYARVLDWSEVVFMPPWLSAALVVICAATFLSFTGLLLFRAAQA